jgi:acetylornithine/succinyldiaminopimelate/putrescine aminotransferase
VSFKGGFHGRTLGALSLTHKPSIRVPFEPYLGMGSDESRFGTYNDVAGIDALVTDDVAVVFVEPVQGEGGVHPATPEFLAALRAACDRTGALLVFDEIQIGVGRSGKLFAYEGVRGPDGAVIEPDMVTLAKPLAGGLPVGAVLAKSHALSGLKRGDHGTTFGGSPLVSAAANAVLDIIAETDFLDDVARKGDAIRSALRAIDSPAIIDVRGLGMLIGIQVPAGTAGDVVAAARERGLIVITAGDKNDCVRLAPPLNIGWDKLDEGIKVLTGVFETLGKKM